MKKKIENKIEEIKNQLSEYDKKDKDLCNKLKNVVGVKNSLEQSVEEIRFSKQLLYHTLTELESLLQPEEKEDKK